MLLFLLPEPYKNSTIPALYITSLFSFLASAHRHILCLIFPKNPDIRPELKNLAAGHIGARAPPRIQSILCKCEISLVAPFNFTQGNIWFWNFLSFKIYRSIPSFIIYFFPREFPKLQFEFVLYQFELVLCQH